jgi:hypothetical protein
MSPNDYDIFRKYDLVEVDESFPIPELPDTGLILLVGSSGSGKSTILRHYFGEVSVSFGEKPLFLEFTSPIQAENLLIACGLRSIPTWRRPFSALSNGEKHRAECAKALDNRMEALDEFSSVVDRDTAKALSFALQKYFRRNTLKRLVVATCHRDVIEWLNPDHLYDTDFRKWVDTDLPRGYLWRPSITLTIRSQKDEEKFWEYFRRHHYLSASFNKAANVFVAEMNGKAVGMCAIVAFPNQFFKNAWREHRTVVLPEFQGLGIGCALSETVARIVLSKGGRFFSKTSHPAFGVHRDKSALWRPTSRNHMKRVDYKKDHGTKEREHQEKHADRICYSHEFIGD